MRRRTKLAKLKVGDKKVFTCQFCRYTGPGWKKGGHECPKCNKSYDHQMAQDNEDQP